MPSPKTFAARLARLEALERAEEAQRPTITATTPLRDVWWLCVALTRRGALWQNNGRWCYPAPQWRGWIDGLLADEPLGYTGLATLCAILDGAGDLPPMLWPDELDTLQGWLDDGQIVDDDPHVRGLSFAEGAFVTPQNVYGGVSATWIDVLRLTSDVAPTLAALRVWLPAARTRVAQMEAPHAEC